MLSQNSDLVLPRRHDIDALRVIAFTLLIFYHIGMFYVSNWDWHVKSQYQSQFLENIMLLFNHWRLPLLFLISGLAIRFALHKISMVKFLGIRHVRLLIPLAFAVLVIVPPQLYYEMTQNGDLQMGYWQFYRVFFDLDNPVFEAYQAGVLPHMDVNHMWYIRELWTFTIYLLILLPVLHSRYVQQGINWFIAKSSQYWVMALPIIPISLLSLLADSGTDSYREALGFTFLLYGYLLGWNTQLWHQLKKYRYIMLLLALLSYVVILFVYNLVWLPQTHALSTIEQWLIILLRSINRWCWVAAILGFSKVHLNKPSAWLSYLNKAVYPYYILHQSIIVVVGYHLSQYTLGAIAEPILLIVITFLTCFLAYEYLIRRARLLRLLFGLKWLAKDTLKPKP